MMKNQKILHIKMVCLFAKKVGLQWRKMNDKSVVGSIAEEHRHFGKKWIRWSALKKKTVFGILALTFGICFALSGIHAVYTVQMQREIASRIIRFHVRANSDCAEDQALKLKVRDGIGALMEKKLASVQDLEESRAIIQESIPQIEACSRKILQENGCQDPVSAKLTDAWFPLKRYGNSVFPQGTYEALQVTIGAGEGHNWWCVMYPNLCFTGSLYQIDEQENEQKLRQVLTPQEYQMVMESKEYNVRFQLLKFLNPK